MRIRNDTRLAFFHCIHILLIVAAVVAAFYATELYPIIISVDTLLIIGILGVIINILMFYVGSIIIKNCFEYSIKSTPLHNLAMLILTGGLGAIFYFFMEGDLVINVDPYVLIWLVLGTLFFDSIIIYPLILLRIKFSRSYRYPPNPPNLSERKKKKFFRDRE